MEEIKIESGKIKLSSDFLNSVEAGKIFDQLYFNTHWRQDDIRIFGKWVKQPRKTAIYSDQGISYTYSGLRQETNPWTPLLGNLKNKIEVISGSEFSLVLLNLYRDGNDSMGWHSDDEKELGKNPVIASVSLGAERKLKFRPKKHLQANPFEILLSHGSLLLMEGETQHHWQHAIAKNKKINEPRINLTFRKVF